jgi:hypothetical protein
LEHITGRGCARDLRRSSLASWEGGLQELEETAYWLELLGDSCAMKRDRLRGLLDEADELTAILTTCVKDAKRRNHRKMTTGAGMVSSFTLHPCFLFA